jgi:hypothetical protein
LSGAYEVSQETWQLVTVMHVEGVGLYFMSGTHKIIMTLILVVLVLVWLELT